MRPAGLIGFAPLDRRGGGVLVGGLTVGNGVVSGRRRPRRYPADSRPLWPVPANAAFLESGRHAGEAVSATICCRRPIATASR